MATSPVTDGAPSSLSYSALTPGMASSAREAATATATATATGASVASDASPVAGAGTGAGASMEEQKKSAIISPSAAEAKAAADRKKRRNNPTGITVEKDTGPFTWDLVLVFRRGRPGKMIPHKGLMLSEPGWFQQVSAKIVKELREDARLKVHLYRGQEDDKIFCLVGATEARLREEASHSDWDLAMSRDALLKFGNELMVDDGEGGKVQGERLAGWCSQTDEDREYEPYRMYKDFKPQYFENMYGTWSNAYEADARKNVFVRYDNEGPMRPDSLFKAVDRIKLTVDIINAEQKEGGAGVNTKQLCGDPHHPLVAVFPLHNHDRLETVTRNWMTWRTVLRQPLNKIRDYFGEHTALYFYFMQFYSRWLVVPGVVGLVLWLVLVANGLTTQAVATPIFGGLVCIWATLFLEFWKRAESAVTTRWGQTHFLEKESRRPGYQGEWLPSPVDARLEEQFSEVRKLWRQVVTHNVVLLLMMVVVMSVVGIFFFKQTLVAASPTYGAYGSAILNALQIQILNLIYGRLAIFMTEWENHRTETQFTNALIFKTFLFKFVNSYNSMIYIAFFKKYEEGCTNDDCMPELAKQLGTIFVTSSLVTHALEFALPWWNRRQTLKRHQALGKRSALLSQAELEFPLTSTDSNFTDFSEVVITYGYATLFVVAFPAAPMLCLISTLVEIKLDSWKLSKNSRRAIPLGAQNIGEWYSILNVMGFIAVLINCAIVIFAAPSGDSLSSDTTTKWLIFIVAEHLLFVLKAILIYFVPDQPEHVRVHLARQEYINRVYLAGAAQPEEAAADWKETDPDHRQNSHHYQPDMMPRRLEGKALQHLDYRDELRRVIEDQVAHVVEQEHAAAAERLRYKHGDLAPSHAVTMPVTDSSSASHATRGAHDPLIAR